MDNTWDCIVVGGGAAGLSAALVLGRARRPTLVVDAGVQSNRVAHGIGGLLGHDGRPPAELYAAGRAELAAYPTVQVRSGEVRGGDRQDGSFVMSLADGSREVARRVLLATGMDYRFPALPGIAERWGRSVFHCPFCHGWEVRDQPLAVLDGNATGVQRALLLRVWSDDVTLLTDGPAGLAADDAARLRAAGVRSTSGGSPGCGGRMAPSRRLPSPTAASARAADSSYRSPCTNAQGSPSSSAPSPPPRGTSSSTLSRSTRCSTPAPPASPPPAT